MLLEYLPVLLMTGLTVFLAVFILFISSLVRPDHPSPTKNQPYECGVDPLSEASTGRFKVQYFIVAILFIVFDVEALYLFPWAVVLQDIGLFAYIEMFIFLALIIAGFAYAWAKGALEWES